MSEHSTARAEDSVAHSIGAIAEDARMFLGNIVESLRKDERLRGVLIGGSAIGRETDSYSDLDLVLVYDSSAYDEILASRRAIAESLGSLLAAFTGEHVGEPRLLVCLYADPLVHVDLKFVTPDMLDERVETPTVLWADERTHARLSRGSARWPNRSPEWFEERFWVWIHYGAQKAGRGELFEAIGMLSFLRENVLGPMIARNGGQDQRGVRRVEMRFPDWASRLEGTMPRHDSTGVFSALGRAVDIYLELRRDHFPENSDSGREQAVRAYLAALAA